MKKFNLIGSIIEVHFLDPWNLPTTLTGLRSSEFLSPQTPIHRNSITARLRSKSRDHGQQCSRQLGARWSNLYTWFVERDNDCMYRS